MDTAVLLVLAAAIFLWGALSARLERADLSAPIVFVVVGAVLTAAGTIDAISAPEMLKPMVDITLV